MYTHGPCVTVRRRRIYIHGPCVTVKGRRDVCTWSLCDCEGEERCSYIHQDP